ncbi:aldehyde dehydrogenase family protein, partial [Cupriavidus sp. CuC1]|uniref:aldehyde dehydrogenase family protein n=1 Tax=Cupriavidus sp. CuC1 TaxID=3373131 RepID=UPI0037D23AE2
TPRDREAPTFSSPPSTRQTGSADGYFAPAATLFRVRSVEHAVSLANDSPFGLGSSCWTADLEEQQQFVNRLQTGQTFLNAPVASDPRLPFGGVKRSGYGRELGQFGLREFVNAKTVVRA